jgi:hypothetical protein
MRGGSWPSPLFAAIIGLAKPPPILHTALNKPLGKRQNTT